ncbi:MAG: hypothetical protein IT260_15810 [Saprospiraceae bacterium]|nr:hypothetical protein [Saprospiraceae bacterium]
MKSVLLLFALLSCAPLFSQSNIALLENLEGRWLLDDRQQAVLSEWTLTSTSAAMGRTLALVCQDTVELSRIQIQLAPGAEQLTLWADSLRAEGPQQFRLLRNQAEELLWENMDPKGRPQRLAWLFYSDKYFTFRSDEGRETNYQRVSAQQLRLRARAQVGLNRSTRPTFNNRNFQNAIEQYNRLDYQAQSGWEYALVLGLGSAGSPLSCYLEVGHTERQIGVFSVMDQPNVRFIQQGSFRYSSTYLAFVPELSFGRRQALTLSTGFYVDVATRSQFNGSLAASGPGASDTSFPVALSGHTAARGLLAGLAYKLPVAALAGLQPCIFARGMFDLGNGAHLRTFSAGLQLRLAKE